MKSFITGKKDTEITAPITVKVYSKYDREDYDALDAKAIKRGFFPVNSESDVRLETTESFLVGMQNSNLHSGWIATTDDYNVKATDQLRQLNLKVQQCIRQGEKVIIGFCQTGHFSIGYSLYVKKTRVKSVDSEGNRKTYPLGPSKP